MGLMASRLPPSFRYVPALLALSGAFIVGMGIGLFWSGSSMEQAVQTQIHSPSCAGEAPCAPANEWPEYQLGWGYVSLGEFAMVAGGMSIVGATAFHFGIRARKAKDSAASRHSGEVAR